MQPKSDTDLREFARQCIDQHEHIEDARSAFFRQANSKKAKQAFEEILRVAIARADRVNILDILLPQRNGSREIRQLLEQSMDENPQATQSELYALVRWKLALDPTVVGCLLTSAIGDAMFTVAGAGNQERAAKRLRPKEAQDEDAESAASVAVA